MKHSFLFFVSLTPERDWEAFSHNKGDIKINNYYAATTFKMRLYF